MSISDADTTVGQIKEWVRAFCDERGWSAYHSPKDLAIGLVTESSELLELFRFVSERDQGSLMKDKAHRSKVADELADALYFVARFAEMYGFDLSTCVREKLEKNSKKYPAPPLPSR